MEPKERARAVREGPLIGEVAFRKGYYHPQYSAEKEPGPTFHCPTSYQGFPLTKPNHIQRERESEQSSLEKSASWAQN